MNKLICSPLIGVALLLSAQTPIASVGAEKKLKVFSWWASGVKPAAVDGAPHKQDCLAWLKTCGSKEAQEGFIPLKGSIPRRTDIEKSKFGPYQNWEM
ncbi:MAG: hypothetical protein JO298_08690, partial [Verrucomicrobia bacterium]|nr:hypothetical protein [Verrucomicrobiota bacterium]